MAKGEVHGDHGDEGSKLQHRKPKWLLSIEQYRVLLELLGSIVAVVALLALVLSYKSVESSNRAAESARRAVQLQEAQLQPLFLAHLDFGVTRKGESSPQELRVVSPSGAFLDARADEAAFLVLEAEDRGEQALVPFIDRYWSPLDDQRDPKGRGVQIGSWKSDGSWLNQVKCQWQQLGHFSDNSYVVSFIRIQYRDILRVERELYFKVGSLANIHDSMKIMWTPVVQSAKLVVSES